MGPPVGMGGGNNGGLGTGVTSTVPPTSGSMMLSSSGPVTPGSMPRTGSSPKLEGSSEDEDEEDDIDTDELEDGSRR